MKSLQWSPLSHRIKPEVLIAPFEALAAPPPCHTGLLAVGQTSLPAQAGLRGVVRNVTLVWDTFPCIPACVISSLHLDLCSDGGVPRGLLWPPALSQAPPALIFCHDP